MLSSLLLPVLLMYVSEKINALNRYHMSVLYVPFENMTSTAAVADEGACLDATRKLAMRKMKTHSTEINSKHARTPVAPTGNHDQKSEMGAMRTAAT